MATRERRTSTVFPRISQSGVLTDSRTGKEIAGIGPKVLASVLWKGGAVPTINSSRGLDSITDDSVGLITFTFSQPLADYVSIFSTCTPSSLTPVTVSQANGSGTATTIQLAIVDTTGAATDPDGVSLAIWGEP